MGDNDSFEAIFDIKMIDLLQKVPRWKKHNENSHGHIFHVKRDDNDKMFTIARESIETFTLCDILEMTNIANDTSLKIIGHIKEVNSIHLDNESALSYLHTISFRMRIYIYQK